MASMHSIQASVPADDFGPMLPANQRKKVPVKSVEDVLFFPASFQPGQQIVLAGTAKPKVKEGTILLNITTGESLSVEQDSLVKTYTPTCVSIDRKITLSAIGKDGDFTYNVHTIEGRAEFRDGRILVDRRQRKQKKLTGYGMVALASAFVVGAGCVKVYSWIKGSSKK